MVLSSLTMLHTSYPAYEDGTDRVFRNVGIQQSDAGEIPKRIHTRFVMFGVLLPCTLLTAGEVKHLNVENSDVGNTTQNVSEFLLAEIA